MQNSCTFCYRLSFGNVGDDVEVLHQTRETVFLRDIQTPRRELNNTTRSGVFLTKFEVFG